MSEPTEQDWNDLRDRERRAVASLEVWMSRGDGAELKASLPEAP